MNCETARQWLPLYLYGELSFEQEEQLERHLAECAACRAEREKERQWQAVLDSAEMEPPPGLLAHNRRMLRAALDEERAGAGRPWRRLAGWLLNPPAWAKPVGALAVFALGFVVARVPLDLSLAGIRPAEPAAIARVRRVDPEASGRIHIDYDVLQPREVVGAPNDKRVVRALLAAASDPADPGLRVESLELLKRQAGTDDEVRSTLLNVLQTDNNSAVRLKALEALKSFAADSETRRVLCHLLLNDDNEAVRAKAVDLISASQEPEVIGTLQELLRREPDDYIRARTQKLLVAVKASTGTF